VPTAYYFLGACVVLAVLVASVALSHRRARPLHHDAVERELRQHGLTLVAIRVPRPFETGPFPLFPFRRGRFWLNLPGISGWHCECRVVTFRSGKGDVYETWAMIEFWGIRGLARITWKPDLDLFATG